jgi:glycosyltransferase involved in cell wall biosynthesis
MNKGLLIFPIYSDVEAESSVNKKNKGIVQAFRKLDVSIDVISCSSKGCFLNDELVYAYSTNKYLRWFQNRHWQYLILGNKIRWEEYQFMWIRMGLLNISKLIFFNKLRRRGEVKVILEYGAFPFYKELKGAIVLGIPFDYIFRAYLHRYVAYAVTYCGQKSILRIPVIPIGNGIDIDAISKIEKEKNDDKIFRILSVSTLQYWHGIDRVLKGIAMLKNSGIKTHLNIIGWGPELENLKKLVKELEIEDSIQFSGYVVGQALDDAFTKADFAAGTLGMHRKNLKNDSSLKNREYCARGIPFFLSAHDADFPATFPYVKYISPDDGAVDIKELLDFYNKLKSNHSDYGEVMQEYAVDNLSWESKIKIVLMVLNNG